MFVLTHFLIGITALLFLFVTVEAVNGNWRRVKSMIKYLVLLSVLATASCYFSQLYNLFLIFNF